MAGLMSEREFWTEMRRSLVQIARAEDLASIRRAVLRMVQVIERRHLGEVDTRETD